MRGFEAFKIKYFLHYLTRSPIVTALRFVERVRFRLKMVTVSIPGVIFFVNKDSVIENLDSISAELVKWTDGNIVTGHFILTKWNLKSLKTAYKVLCSGGMLIIGSRAIRQKYSLRLMITIFMKRFR